MTPERNDNNSNRRRTTPDRQQRRREAQARHKRQAILRLVLVVAALAMAAGLIAWVTKNAGSGETLATTQTPSTETVSPSGTDEEVWETEPTTVIHVAAAGDLNVTDEIVSEAMTASGYNFDETFLDVAPVLGAADLTILNFEGTLSGAPYGFQTGSAPASLAEKLAQIGVDAVLTANSASIRSGVLGLQSTISGLKNVGIQPIGTFTNSDEFKKTGGFTMMEVDGIRVALVGFTKGMDNLGLPEGSADCVNILYKDYTTDYKEIDKDEITKVLRNVAAEEPDITIAMLHWGSEYNENVSSSQEDIAELMLDNGVDVIIGSHSHLLQAIEYDELAGTLVAWSLGDFYGNATEAGSNYSAVLDIEITMDNQLGIASITNYSVTPIYTLKPEQSLVGGHRVVQIEKALARYESRYIGRITDDTYSSMSYALTRVGQRITPDTE